MKKTSHKKMRSAAPTIVVLGAGINGAALARQFVLNDAHVILTDTRDIAGGTTAWSTRLIHGGLRYLEYGEFDLVSQGESCGTKSSRQNSFAPCEALAVCDSVTSTSGWSARSSSANSGF